MIRVKHQIWNESKQEFVDVPLDDCPNHVIEVIRLLSRHQLTEVEVKAYVRRSLQES